MTATYQYTSDERKKRIKAIVGAASGNLVEWFDFYIFAVFATYFKESFTPANMPETTKAIYVWGVFAASFFMRPVGSWLFGRIADRYGRKRSMLISISMMCGSSLCFALLPTYNQIGIFSTLLLLVVRLFQGLSVGGEYGAVATYMSEIALKGRRGFFASFQYVTLAGGQLLASLLGVVLLFLLSEEQLRAGGWRIPFVIGALAAVLSLWIRRTLEETISQEERNKSESGSLKELFTKHWKAFITVVGYTTGGSLSFYTITVYAKTYIASNSVGVGEVTAGYIMTAALFVFMVVQPIFGSIADNIGRRASMLLFSGLGAICIFPIMVIGMPLLANYPLAVWLLLVILMLILSFYTSIGGLVKAEMFPKEIRALGVGLSYAIANAIFGGSAPTVALIFKGANQENIFFVYVVCMLLVSFAFSWRIPKEPEYLQHDH